MNSFNEIFIHIIFYQWVSSWIALSHTTLTTPEFFIFRQQVNPQVKITFIYATILSETPPRIDLLTRIMLAFSNPHWFAYFSG